MERFGIRGQGIHRRGIGLAILFFCLLSGLLGEACGPGLGDSVAKLGGSVEEREEGRQELLLAKDRAVEPLLAALEEERYSEARPELVEVLVGLMTRVDDARIRPALLRHLRDDPDPRVRARIARRLGMYEPRKFVEPLLAALGDEEGAVCYQALLAVGKVEEELTESQRELLLEQARRLAADPHRGARLEAQIRVESIINEWVEEARQMALQARLTEAES
ncbi:MAG: HEAT repeat domain-containing protein, partial [Gemmatimonadetes bacterium]|nr:HEAT repeat domain-containing protein [Gemmatimonadota bacterium]